MNSGRGHLLQDGRPLIFGTRIFEANDRKLSSCTIAQYLLENKSEFPSYYTIILPEVAPVKQYVDE